MIVPVLTVISAMQIMRTHPSPVPGAFVSDASFTGVVSAVFGGSFFVTVSASVISLVASASA